jgi:hypothetical protein
MDALAQKLHLLGTLAFVVMSAVVGVRLLLLSRRSGQRPELFLGLGILGTAVLGYGPLIASAVLQSLHPQSGPTDLEVALGAAGKTLHNAGVTMILLFVLRVFRPAETWARALFGAAMLALWSGYAGVLAGGGLRDPALRGFFFWLEYAVIWTYPAWNAVESFRYHAMMRRREQLGLADPLVTNRFGLWGVASLFTLGAIWSSSAPIFLAGDPARLAAWTPMLYVLTAVFGVVTVSCYALTFFPPAWYRRWVVSAARAPA